MTDATAELSAEDQFAALRAARTSDNPTAEPVKQESAEPPEPAEPQAEPTPEAAPTDPFAGWPDAAKAKYQEAEALAKKLAQERDAAVGRLAPIQRKLSELQSTSVAPKARPEPRTPAPQSRRPDSYFDSAEWKEFERDYPDEAKRQRKAIEAERQAVIEDARRIAREEAMSAAGKVRDELGRFVSPHIERIQERERAEAVAKLTTEHPDWSQHFSFIPVRDDAGNVVSYEPQSSPKFDAWFDSLHRRDQDSVREALWSDDPDDCTWVVNRFKSETGEVDSAANTAIANKAERRRQNLESSVQPASTPTPAPVRVNPEDLSDEDRFALIRAQKKR